MVGVDSTAVNNLFKIVLTEVAQVHYGVEDAVENDHYTTDFMEIYVMVQRQNGIESSTAKKCYTLT